MNHLFFLLACCLSLFSQELQVSLPTRSSSTPIYLSRLHTDPSEWDWVYFEELRTVLEFDLHAGGFATIVPIRDALEDTFQWSDVRKFFRVDTWRKEGISFVFSIQVEKKRLSLVVFNVQKESSKKYPDLLLSGKMETDRRAIHRLSDLVHKDLFGTEGIASLRILYSQRSKNPHEGLSYLSEIYICDSDGGNPSQLTHQNGYCMSPGFFPKSSEDPTFYYVFNNEGQSKIYRASLSRPQGEILISLRGNQALPAINKKGDQMAFITDIAGRPDLFIQTLDTKGRHLGQARQLYSSPRATQASPTFSPDGKKIAFVSDKDGPPRIYLLDLPRSGKDTQRPKPHLLTTKNRENTSPAWSPDGKKLAYSAKTEGIRQIWIYNFETEEEIQLTTGSEIKENPAWAPDSLHLVYNTENEESCELYILSIQNPDPLLISKGTGQKRFPVWETREYTPSS
jgi:TolB protein